MPKMNPTGGEPPNLRYEDRQQAESRMVNSLDADRHRPTFTDGFDIDGIHCRVTMSRRKRGGIRRDWLGH